MNYSNTMNLKLRSIDDKIFTIGNRVFEFLEEKYNTKLTFLLV